MSKKELTKKQLAKQLRTLTEDKTPRSEGALKKDLKNLYIDSNTRTAKTIFEDEQAN